MGRHGRYEAVWKEGLRLRRFRRVREARLQAARKKGYVRDLDAYKRILNSLT